MRRRGAYALTGRWVRLGRLRPASCPGVPWPSSCCGCSWYPGNGRLGPPPTWCAGSTSMTSRFGRLAATP
eukprot:8887252-Lingulodinium_polyedra.AAC.1